MSEGLPPDEQRVRRPRLHLSYEGPLDGSRITLPFVIGVIGDFSAHATHSLAPLAERRFVQVSRDNLDEVMRQTPAGLNLQVENRLDGRGGELAVSLSFQALEDFHPNRVAQQVAFLTPLVELRQRLAARVNNPDDDSDQRFDEISTWLQNLDASAARPTDVDRVRRDALRELDERCQHQLNAILGHPEFQRLEGRWRGLQRIVMNVPPNTDVSIEVLPATKAELQDGMAKGPYESQLAYLIHEADESNRPFAMLVGDYAFSHREPDVRLLQNIADLCATWFCPFVSNASPEFFDVESWSETPPPRQVARTAEAPSHTVWRSLRDSDDAHFVALAASKIFLNSDREADPNDPLASDPVHQSRREARESVSCLMGGALFIAERAVSAYLQTGLGAEILAPAPGDSSQCDAPPTASCEAMANAGFAAIDASPEGGLQLVCAPMVAELGTFREPEQVQNSRVWTTLPCVMATSRFVHYVKAVMRSSVDLLGPKDVGQAVHQWLLNYVGIAMDESESEYSKAMFPLLSADVQLHERPERFLEIRIQPRLPYEQLAAPLSFLLPF